MQLYACEIYQCDDIVMYLHLKRTFRVCDLPFPIHNPYRALFAHDRQGNGVISQRNVFLLMKTSISSYLPIDPCKTLRRRTAGRCGEERRHTQLVKLASKLLSCTCAWGVSQKTEKDINSENSRCENEDHKPNSKTMD